MAKKYKIDYQLLYRGMDDQGLLRRRHKNVEYDEREVLNACQRYLYRRILRLRQKTRGLEMDRAEIVDILKNAFTE